MRKIDLIAAVVFIAIIALLAGCLTTGTAVITARLAPDSEGNSVRVTNLNFGTFAEMEVDLKDDATFRDYQDDIKNIDNIGFYLSITNNKAADVTFQLFLEPDTTVNYESVDGMVEAYADIILTDLTVPGFQKVVVDWNQSMEYVTNLLEFKDVLAGGVFSIYAAALPRADFDVTIDSLVAIVTLTGNK
jgi:hypothetical protein